MIRVRIKRDQKHADLPLPEYMSVGSAGMDLRAAVAGQVTQNLAA